MMLDSLRRRFGGPQPKQIPEVLVASERFYKAVMKDKSVRIIDASHPTKVRLHIADGLIESVEPASARDVVDAHAAGVKPEVAGETGAA